MIFRNHLPKQHPQNAIADSRSAVIVAMGLASILGECQFHIENRANDDIAFSITYWQTLQEETRNVLDDLAMTFSLSSKQLDQMIESEYVKCRLDRLGTR